MSTVAHAAKSPRQLYDMAKTFGVWDPAKIPLADDRAHWATLDPGQREQLIKICALFYEGEVSVADTLAWFMLAMPDPGRRMFLAAQVFEEVKHAEFFERYFQEVCGQVDTSAYLVPEFKGVLLDDLRRRGESMGRAMTGGHRQELDFELTMFATHYMGIIEGVMAVSGYDFFDDLLASTNMFPRLLEGLRLIRADEGRHIVHGMDYLREKLVEHPEYKEPVRKMFLEQSKNIPFRTEFIFTPNAFGLDKERMMSISYDHNRQRMNELGL